VADFFAVDVGSMTSRRSNRAVFLDHHAGVEPFEAMRTSKRPSSSRPCSQFDQFGVVVDQQTSACRSERRLVGMPLSFMNLYRLARNAPKARAGDPESL